MKGASRSEFGICCLLDTSLFEEYHLVYECLRIFQTELEVVAGEKDVWVALLSMCLHNNSSTSSTLKLTVKMLMKLRLPGAHTVGIQITVQ